jgi:hypothetical protein
MPGAFITCTATYTVTAADIVNGQVTNIAVASAMYGTTIVESNEDTVTVPAITSACPDNAVGHLWTDILGQGMGTNKSHTLMIKLAVPNSANVVDLYGQLAGKSDGTAKYVRFIYPNNTYVQVSPVTVPAPQKYAVMWYGSELTPSSNIRGRWFLNTSGAKTHIPRAFMLYPTYNDPTKEYANVFELIDTSDSQVYWDVAQGWSPTKRLTIDIPAPQVPVTFNIKLAMVDNDPDNRPVYVTVSAGGVTQTQSPVGPNKGNQLNILTYTLANVPPGTEEIVIDLFSPSPGTYGLGTLGGDSAAITGVTANYRCELP